ncbi:hypothetical protein BHE97_13630 [Aeromicrobium sp. PE09-221]|uniref:Hsp70 family protein n=1 Tax=Aeromicrobium sp. PE09-221 TaxID=1898043 RepID=UPI000B6C4FA1|nr:Hsp70 family protein [Aeromicrobium sp. PE09-221]OUZ08268.1 hypothetical protein BHE97_13630 [Aeromicrobium sp. PE09-221]
MIGIDVGATEATHSDYSTLAHGVPDAPPDLLVRVANDRPAIRLDTNGCELRPAPEIFADLVAHAVRQRPIGDVAPTAVAVPAWWTPRVLDQVRAALAARDVRVALVNDAEAAVAEHRAMGHDVPETVAVLSVRAEYSSVAIVEHCPEQPVARATPVYVHDEGGTRLDVAILRHLVAGLVDLGDEIEVGSPDTIGAARVALHRCRELREALSTSAVESAHIDLPGAVHRLRLVRSELDELADPWIRAVIQMTDSAITQYAGPVGAVMIVGGLAAMPMVSQRLSAGLGLEVIVTEEPEFIVARGARRIAENNITARGSEGRRSSLWTRRRSRATGKRRRGAPTAIEASPVASRRALRIPPGSLDESAPEQLAGQFVPVEASVQATGDRQFTS